MGINKVFVCWITTNYTCFNFEVVFSRNIIPLTDTPWQTTGKTRNTFLRNTKQRERFKKKIRSRSLMLNTWHRHMWPHMHVYEHVPVYLYTYMTWMYYEKEKSKSGSSFISSSISLANAAYGSMTVRFLRKNVWRTKTHKKIKLPLAIHSERPPSTSWKPSSMVMIERI